MSQQKQPTISDKKEANSLSVGSGNLADNGIELADFVEVVAKNWKMIAKVTGSAAVIAIIISLCLPKIYIATARILPPQQSSGLLGALIGASGSAATGIAADLMGATSQSDTYVGILNSEAMGDSIIDKFMLMDVYDLKYRVEAYKVLKSYVDISAGKKDGIISITVSDEDPQRAANMANAYVDELDKLLVKLNVIGSGQERLFYGKMLAKSRIDLAKAEDDLKAFQTKYKIIDITEQAKGAIKGIADLEGSLALEEIKLQELNRHFTVTSQEVKNQKSIISAIKSQIGKFEGDRSGIAVPGVGSVPEIGQQYLRLMREFKVKESIVELLTKQYEMSKVFEAKEEAALQVIQRARVPDKKSKPKRTIIVLGVTVAALFLSIIYAFIIEALVQMSVEERERWRRIGALLPKFHRLKEKQ